LNSSGRSGSGKFTKSGRTGTRNFKVQFAKKIVQFEKDPFHPSLKTHTLGGGSSYYRHMYNTSQELLFFMKSVSRIILDPSVLAGKPVIRGTRISVDLVLELLASGWNESTILKEYPGLKRQDILACIRYAQEIVRSERVYSTTAHGKITG